eukprot:g33806.t1
MSKLEKSAIKKKCARCLGTITFLSDGQSVLSGRCHICGNEYTLAQDMIPVPCVYETVVDLSAVGWANETSPSHDLDRRRRTWTSKLAQNRREQRHPNGVSQENTIGFLLEQMMEQVGEVDGAVLKACHQAQAACVEPVGDLARLSCLLSLLWRPLFCSCKGLPAKPAPARPSCNALLMAQFLNCDGANRIVARLAPQYTAPALDKDQHLQQQYLGIQQMCVAIVWRVEYFCSLHSGCSTCPLQTRGEVWWKRQALSTVLVHLSNTAISPGTIATLFTLLLTNPDRPAQPHPFPLQSLDLPPPREFLCVSIWPLICFGLAYSTLATMKDGLEALSMFVLRKPDNATAMCQTEWWFSHWLPLLTCGPHIFLDPNGQQQASGKDNKEIFSLAANIVCELLSHRFNQDGELRANISSPNLFVSLSPVNEPFAFKRTLNSAANAKVDLGEDYFDFVQDALGLLEDYTGWTPQAIGLSRVLLGSLTSRVAKSRVLRASFDEPDHAVGGSLFALLEVIENFLFYSPVSFQPRPVSERAFKQFAVHVGASKKAEDLNLVQQVVGILSRLNTSPPILIGGSAKTKLLQRRRKRLQAELDFFDFVIKYLMSLSGRPHLHRNYADKLVVHLEKRLHTDHGRAGGLERFTSLFSGNKNIRKSLALVMKALPARASVKPSNQLFDSEAQLQQAKVKPSKYNRRASADLSAAPPADQLVALRIILPALYGKGFHNVLCKSTYTLEQVKHLIIKGLPESRPVQWRKLPIVHPREFRLSNSQLQAHYAETEPLHQLLDMAHELHWLYMVHRADTAQPQQLVRIQLPPELTGGSFTLSLPLWATATLIQQLTYQQLKDKRLHDMPFVRGMTVAEMHLSLIEHAVHQREAAHSPGTLPDCLQSQQTVKELQSPSILTNSCLILYLYLLEHEVEIAEEALNKLAQSGYFTPRASPAKAASSIPPHLPSLAPLVEVALPDASVPEAGSAAQPVQAERITQSLDDSITLSKRLNVSIRKSRRFSLVEVEKRAQAVKKEQEAEDAKQRKEADAKEVKKRMALEKQAVESSRKEQLEVQAYEENAQKHEEDREVGGGRKPRGRGQGGGQAKCTHCAEVVEEEDQYEKSGQIYCERHYLALFCSCRGCDKLINKHEEYSRLSVGEHEYLFHQNHVQCFECKKELKDGDPVVHFPTHRIYCEEHYLKRHGERCCLCREMISTERMVVGSESFHPTCFSCCGPCQQVLDADDAFISLPWDSKEMVSWTSRLPVHSDEDKRSTLQRSQLAEAIICNDCFWERLLPDCGVCQQPIGHGKRVWVKGAIKDEVFHESCFVCAVPTCLSSSGELHAQDDKWYCSQHFRPNGGRACAICEQIIREQGVLIRDILYHATCIQCQACTAPLSQDQIFVAEDALRGTAQQRLLCALHFRSEKLRLMASSRENGLPNCGSCGQSIRLGGIRLEGGDFYHDKCIACSVCGCRLRAGPVARTEEEASWSPVFKAPTSAPANQEGLLYCQMHYAHTFISSCPQCSQPLAGKVAKIAAARYHAACLVCSYCGVDVKPPQFSQDAHTKLLYCWEHSYIPVSY